MRLGYLKRHLDKAKICSNCGSLNYYKNYKCTFCKSRYFIKNKELILKEIKSRYEFYKMLGFKLREINSLDEEIESRL